MSGQQACNSRDKNITKNRTINNVNYRAVIYIEDKLDCRSLNNPIFQILIYKEQAISGITDQT